MAGMQSCFLRVVLRNSLLSHKNVVTVQSHRARHFLIFRTPLNRNTQCLNKLNLYTKSKTLFRLASTNVIATEKVEQVVKASETVGKETPKAVNEATTPVSSAPAIDEAALPAVPAPIDDTLPVDYLALGLKEPPFESLGLGGYWPPGLIQQLLEYLHIQLDLPWWGAIAVVTLSFRIMLFPLFVKARRKTVSLNNNLPQLQLLQAKVTEARATGNYYDAATTMQELQKFMEEKKIGLFGPLLPSLAQAPVFLSMYLALKKMAAAPVESMKTGGLFWFTDLTVADPYYLLPIITTTTMFVIIEIGAEGGSLKAIQQVWLRFGMRLVPFLILPFIIKLPEAILVYWTVSNFITLGQVIILKIPQVRKVLNIPATIHHDMTEIMKKKKKKGVIAEMKEGMQTAKLTRELEERERLNAKTFEMAGRGPIKRTFKRNPKEEEVKVSASKN